MQLVSGRRRRARALLIAAASGLAAAGCSTLGDMASMLGPAIYQESQRVSRTYSPPPPPRRATTARTNRPTSPPPSSSSSSASSTKGRSVQDSIPSYNRPGAPEGPLNRRYDPTRDPYLAYRDFSKKSPGGSSSSSSSSSSTSRPSSGSGSSSGSSSSRSGSSSSGSYGPGGSSSSGSYGSPSSGPTLSTERDRQEKTDGPGSMSQTTGLVWNKVPEAQKCGGQSYDPATQACDTCSGRPVVRSRAEMRAARERAKREGVTLSCTQ